MIFLITGIALLILGLWLIILGFIDDEDWFWGGIPLFIIGVIVIGIVCGIIVNYLTFPEQLKADKLNIENTKIIITQLKEQTKEIKNEKLLLDMMNKGYFEKIANNYSKLNKMINNYNLHLVKYRKLRKHSFISCHYGDYSELELIKLSGGK